MKPTRHAVERAVERHGVNGKKRNRKRNIARAVREAMASGIVCQSPLIPWEAEVVHVDGRRWIVDLRTQKIITALPRLETRS